MNIPFVDLKSQYNSIKEEMDAAINAVISRTAFIGGPFLADFEKEFAHFCGTKYCVGVGNGTDALFIALKALGIGAGDEVITAANSFIATSEAITSTGAKVVFVDCEPNNYTIDVSKIEEKISDKTKAIIPVHLYGQAADMDGIYDLAKKYDLAVVEDAAQAHGATYKGRKVGTLGDVACFSFYPGKNLGAYGDGGAIVTNNKILEKRCRMLANHGRLEKYSHDIEGYNSRLDGLQAAILSVKLRHLADWNKGRNRVADYYLEHIKAEQVVLPRKMDGNGHVYHLFIVQVENREAFMDALKKEGISTGIHYPIPLPSQRAYSYLGHEAGDFPVAERLAERIVSLPMFPELREDQLEKIVSVIHGFYE